MLLSLYYWLIDPRQGQRLGVVLSLSYGGNVLLKQLFALPRPYQLDSSVASDVAQSTAGGFAFPSGHAQGSATFWGVLALHYRRLWLWLLGLGVMGLVALSRVYLGVHFGRDVIAGLALGLTFAWLGQRLSVSLPTTRLFPTLMVLGGLGLTIAIPELARPLGVLMGLSLASAQFTPPKTWPRRLLVGVLGLVASFALLFLLKQITLWLAAPPWSDYGRYGLLALFIAEAWPRLWRLGSDAHS